MRIGTDGSFGLGSGTANLLGEPLEVLEEVLVLTSAQLGLEDGRIALNVEGNVNLQLTVRLKWIIRRLRLCLIISITVLRWS